MDGGEEITDRILGAAIVVHRALGPGLLESTYEACLVYELTDGGMEVERQKPLPVDYRGVRIDCGYRIDLLVQNQVIVEFTLPRPARSGIAQLKAVERLLPVHEAQLLTYLRLSGHRVGLLLNFNVPLMKDGIRRLVNLTGARPR